MKNHIFKPSRWGFCTHIEKGEYCGCDGPADIHQVAPPPEGSASKVLRDIADDWESAGADRPNLWYVGYLRGMADVLDTPPLRGGVE